MRTEAERKAGRMTYRPESFEVLVEDACASVLSAIENGETRLEVEFPPLPTSVSGEVTPLKPQLDANTDILRLQGIFR